MKQVAPLRYDVIFKKVFSHPDMFTALVKDFLDIELEIDKVENDKVFVPSVAKVATLFAEDKKNRIIVKVQHYPDTYERFLYYQCSAIATNYKFPVTIITLVFFTEKNNPDSGILVHDMEPRDFISGRVIDKVYNRKHKLFFKVKAL
jgi:hypothetical protein